MSGAAWASAALLEVTVDCVWFDMPASHTELMHLCITYRVYTMAGMCSQDTHPLIHKSTAMPFSHLNDTGPSDHTLVLGNSSASP